RNFESPNDPKEFLALLKDAGLTDIPESNNGAFVSYDLKAKLFHEYKASNQKLTVEYFSTQDGGFNNRPIDDTPLYEPDYTKFVSYLLLLLAKHQKRIMRHNNRLHSLKDAIQSVLEPNR